MVAALPGWSIARVPHSGVWITPIDGWGFVETIDGQLASKFEIYNIRAGVEIAVGILGWKAEVLSPHHKYARMHVEMTPRHVENTGVVVVNVTDGDLLVFSGMADTIGLERDWK